MPELPEVETVRRALEARLASRRIEALAQRRADLRFPLPRDLPARLAGRRLVGFGRRGKYLLLGLDDGRSLVLHLGMSGRLLLDGVPAAAHEHLTFAFDDGTLLRFVDPRRFGMLDLVPTAGLRAHRWLAPLGVEPLEPGFDGSRLRAVLAGRRSPLKAVLMDQRRIAGLGNIYVSEALFRARLSPLCPAGLLTPREAARLARAIGRVLAEAIAAGGSSLRDYVQSDGELGMFQHAFAVYDREGQPCPRCRRPLAKLVQGGRATYHCARCQPLPARIGSGRPPGEGC